MVLYKEGCGHPIEWNLRVINNSTTYTYCIGCLVEKIQLDNLEAYDNPFIKLGNKPKKKAKTVKKNLTEVEKLYENGKTPDEDSLKEAQEKDRKVNE